MRQMWVAAVCLVLVAGCRVSGKQEAPPPGIKQQTADSSRPGLPADGPVSSAPDKASAVASPATAPGAVPRTAGGPGGGVAAGGPGGGGAGGASAPGGPAASGQPATGAISAPAKPATPAQPQPPPKSGAPAPPAVAAPAPGAAPAAGASTAAAPRLQEVARGLTRPLFLTHAGDGTGRLFILEQPGRIRILKDGQLVATPFLDLTARVRSSSNEQGLLGLAFHPQYAGNGAFFVHYSGASGETVIARYKVSADPNRADPDSGQVLLTVPQPYPNHNGGAIIFGPDGYLYIALGDGGSGGDPQNNAQNLNSLLGKVLRLAVDSSGPYRIPPDNPLAGKSGRPEIWAYGLRNPWRISFDGSTGDLYIADVGQSRIEEINFQPSGSRGGENYGWRIFEGRDRYARGELSGAVMPVAQYDHSLGCSVTGGYVYRGRALPALTGTYLFADYCTGRIWGLRRDGSNWAMTELLKTDLTISSFGADADGEVYVVHHQGSVFRLVPGA